MYMSIQADGIACPKFMTKKCHPLKIIYKTKSFATCLDKLQSYNSHVELADRRVHPA